jgi:hypothetical protein
LPLVPGATFYSCNINPHSGWKPTNLTSVFTLRTSVYCRLMLTAMRILNTDICNVRLAGFHPSKSAMLQQTQAFNVTVSITAVKSYTTQIPGERKCQKEMSLTVEIQCKTVQKTWQVMCMVNIGNNINVKKHFL